MRFKTKIRAATVLEALRGWVGRWGGTAADQSVINTVVLVQASSFRLVFKVELNEELMNTSLG